MTDIVVVKQIGAPPPRRPTSSECDAKKLVEHDGEMWLPNYYPQMGGYCGRAWVRIEPRGESCFDCYVYHDGEFPFEEGAPRELHHCSPLQFVEFGTEILEAQITLYKERQN